MICRASQILEDTMPDKNEFELNVNRQQSLVKTNYEPLKNHNSYALFQGGTDQVNKDNEDPDCNSAHWNENMSKPRIFKMTPVDA